MKIYKEKEINIELYREKLNNPKVKYTNHDKMILIQLFDLFEAGKFQDCCMYVDCWSKEDRQMIPQEIWDILIDVTMGDIYKVL